MHHLTDVGAQRLLRCRASKRCLRSGSSRWHRATRSPSGSGAGSPARSGRRSTASRRPHRRRRPPARRRSPRSTMICMASCTFSSGLKASDVGGHHVRDGRVAGHVSPPGARRGRPADGRRGRRPPDRARQARAPARPCRNAPAAAASSAGHALSQQRGDDAGEHVAGAGGGQPGVAGVGHAAPARRARRRRWSGP